MEQGQSRIKKTLKVYNTKVTIQDDKVTYHIFLKMSMKSVIMTGNGNWIKFKDNIDNRTLFKGENLTLEWLGIRIRSTSRLLSF